MNKKLTAGVLASLITVVGLHEGFSSTPYYDSGGVLTDCYGRTKDVKLGTELTKEQCDEHLKREIIEHAKPIESLDIKLHDHVVIAWVDFCYNVGVNACQSSTGYKMLKAGKIEEACDQILRWKYVAGKDCSIRSNNCWGVWERRLYENRLCLGYNESS